MRAKQVRKIAAQTTNTRNKILYKTFQAGAVYK